MGFFFFLALQNVVSHKTRFIFLFWYQDLAQCYTSSAWPLISTRLFSLSEFPAVFAFYSNDEHIKTQPGLTVYPYCFLARRLPGVSAGYLATGPSQESVLHITPSKKTRWIDIWLYKWDTACSLVSCCFFTDTSWLIILFVLVSGLYAKLRKPTAYNIAMISAQTLEQDWSSQVAVGKKVN